MERTEEHINAEREECRTALEKCNAGHYQDAAELWEQLAESGNVTAMIDLARLHYRRLHPAPDLSEAHRWLELAVSRKALSAYRDLGVLMLVDDCKDHSLAKAYGYFRQGADAEDPDCMFEVGRCFLLGEGVEQHTANAMNWLGRAAHADSGNGCYWMGWLFQTGAHIEQDLPMASNFYDRGAVLGHSG